MFVFDLVLKPKTVFQWTDYQHFLLAIMESEKDLIKGRGYALRQWKEEEIVIYFSFSSTFLHREAGVTYFLLFLFYFMFF